MNCSQRVLNKATVLIFSTNKRYDPFFFLQTIVGEKINLIERIKVSSTPSGILFEPTVSIATKALVNDEEFFIVLRNAAGNSSSVNVFSMITGSSISSFLSLSLAAKVLILCCKERRLLLL